MQIEKGHILNDFIEPNKKQYVIPVYQRNYEWSKEQCTRLFEDIIIAAKTDKMHFCGSVVYAVMQEEKGIQYYVIIDGQQRLTTTYLLLKALLDCAENDKTRESITDSLFNKDKFDEFPIDKQSKLKLKPIKSDDFQLQLLMENKKDEVNPNSGIITNYALFCSLINQEQEKGLYVKDIYRGVEKLTCAKIRLDEEDNAQEMFERINSTGIPLSLADKIRNYVLMTDVNQVKLYEQYWLKIEDLIPSKSLNNFFLDYMNFKVEGFTRLDTAYESFKTLYGAQHFSNESMLKELHRYAGYYHTFLFGDGDYSDNVKTYLKSLAQLKQTTVFLFLFALFDDYDNNKGIISEEVLEKVLRFFLNYSIRRMVCEIPSNSLNGLYKTLYARIFSKEENKKCYYDSIVSFFMQLTSNDALPTDESFRTALKNNNLYRKSTLCKYLLSSIENQGKEQVVTGSLSIEHIMPQNKDLSTAWQTMLGGEDWKEVQGRYLHTLGNLMLTGYNSELGDKPFDEKKKKIEEMDTKMVTLYADVKASSVWNASTIEKRAERLSGILLKIFSSDTPHEMVSFADSRYQEYSCEEPENAARKTPNYYVLEGERVSVKNFADIWRSVVAKLYERDNSIIDEMARNNFIPFKGSRFPLFSIDSTMIKHRETLGTAEIFFNMILSPRRIIMLIKILLEKYGIDLSDFSYSARYSTKEGE